MKKILLFATAAITAAAILTGCTAAPDTSAGDGKLKIAASLFPQYDFARQIGGQYAEVSMILPPGTESHTFEPSPNEMMSIYDSDIFIYTGADMEPWAQQVLESVRHENLLVVDVSEGIELEKEAEHEDEHGDDHDGHGFDPHFWLDPSNAAKIIDNITDALCGADPGHQDYFRSNADKYKNELAELDAEISAAVGASGRKTLVFGGRFAYIYFLRHYGLNYVTAYDTCSTEVEPSIFRMLEVMEYIKANDIPVIYYEELSDPKLARSIASDSGIEYLQFSTGHNVTKAEFESGKTYLDVFRDNIENIKKGLV